jgi:hypothetical protein
MSISLFLRLSKDSPSKRNDQAKFEAYGRWVRRRPMLRWAAREVGRDASLPRSTDRRPTSRWLYCRRRQLSG